MTNIRGGGSLPPALQRDRALSQTADNLGKAADKQLDKAGQAAGDAGKHVGKAGIETLGAAVNVAEATFDATKATGNTGMGVGAAIAGAVGKVGEVVLDALGAAAQWFGKGLLGIGDAGRDIAGLGGPQITTYTILGDPKADLFSERMMKLSGDSFKTAGNQWLSSLDHIAGAGVNLAFAAGHVVAAAGKTLEAAVRTGDAGAIKLAQGAVVVAKEALLAAEKGTDTAGKLLQNAGKAVIAAGNAINTDRANDTGTAVRGRDG
jgi:hypothetical protein